MRKIDVDFSNIKVFDVDTAEKLKDFFDISYVEKNPDDYRLWFNNLRVLASQNLGLAHCIVHNQSARNSIEVAYKETGFECFNKPYGSNIGAYSFPKGFAKNNFDTIALNNFRLTGKKMWASQLNTSNYMVLKVRDRVNPKRIFTVFLDLPEISHKVTASENKPLGMNVAFPCDLEIDAQVPPHWILNPNNPEYRKLHNFHFYGLTGNYLSIANSLLEQAIQQGYNVDHEIRKLRLCLDVSEELWNKSLHEVFDDVTPEQFKRLQTQYQFSRKNLIDIIGLFLEVMNTGICDSESERSQVFRDSLSMATHLVNLYRHLDGTIGVL